MGFELVASLAATEDELFVDTVKASCECCVFIGRGWKHNMEGRRWLYFKEVKKDEQSVKLYFYPDYGQPYREVKDGTIYVECSWPKFLYGTNITGVRMEDQEKLFDEITEILYDNDVYIDSIDGGIDFRHFRVKKVDYSISFDAGSEKEKVELFKLIRKMYFPYHDVGMMEEEKYDYDSGSGLSFCHSSDSFDIVMYDKTAEVKKHDGDEIEENICRFEIRCKRILKEHKYSGTVQSLFEKRNIPLVNLLNKFRFDLDILPKEEYWKTIRDYLEEKKAAYKADKEKSKKKSPSYLSSNVDKIYAQLKYINKYGEEAARKKSHASYTIYRKCLELTNELKISILYNKIGKRMNILTKIYEHNDLPEVYKTAKGKLLRAHIESIKASDEAKSDENLPSKEAEISSYGWKGKTKSKRYGFRLGLDPFGRNGKTYKVSPDYRHCIQSLHNIDITIKSIHLKSLYHKRE